MLRYFLFATIALICPAGAAWGTASNSIRTPYRSSIPCEGKLQETLTEGGNVYTAFSDMSLMCLDTPEHAKWIVQASVSAQTDDDAKPVPDADAAPVGRFLVTNEKTHTNDYHLGRYVFTKNCIRLDYTQKTQMPLSSKSSPIENRSGWACKEITWVNGLRDYDFVSSKSVEPKDWKYAHISTEGPDFTTVDDIPGPTILGVTSDMFAYIVLNINGTVERK